MREEVLTEVQLEAELGISRRTLQRWRYQGLGPRFVKLGAAARYRRVDVDRWIREQAGEPADATTGS